MHPGTTLLRATLKQEPKYDERSRKAHVEGTTTLWVVVDTHGMPAQIRVLRRYPLDAAAVRAMKAWRFEQDDQREPERRSPCSSKRISGSSSEGFVFVFAR